MPYIPALILGLILTTYWGRVVRLVYKTRKRTGHSANFRPPESLGRYLRLIWIPTVVIWITHPYVVAFFAPRRMAHCLHPLFRSDALDWLGTGIAALALGVTWVCWRKMGKSWRMGIDPNEQTQLIVTGLYAYVRHPIYALSSLLMLATIAVIPSPLMLGVGLVHLGLLQWEARREEKHLLNQHGSGYADYCNRVGRFVPRSFRPYQPGTPALEISSR